MIYNRKFSKALVVGLGSIALRHRKNLKFLLPNIEITALSASGKITSQNVEFADNVISSMDDIIKKKIDFAIVASPASFHADHVRKLLNVGIPCLIEKPLANNLQNAEKIIKIYNEIKVPVCVGYCIRYMPSAIKMKKLIEQKILGKIYNIFVNVGQYLPDWRPLKNYQDTVSASEFLGGGVLLELSHEIDYIQWLYGSMKVEFANLRCSKELELDVEDLADIIFQSDKEKFLCNLHLDFLQKKPQRMCSVIGEKGRLDWDLVNNTIKWYDKKNIKYLFSGSNWDTNQMYLDLIRNFLNLIEGRQNFTIDLKQAVKTMSLIENIKYNSKQGSKI